MKPKGTPSRHKNSKNLVYLTVTVRADHDIMLDRVVLALEASGVQKACKAMVIRHILDDISENSLLTEMLDGRESKPVATTSLERLLRQPLDRAKHMEQVNAALARAREATR